jgi:hypothetical protein
MQVATLDDLNTIAPGVRIGDTGYAYSSSRAVHAKAKRRRKGSGARWIGRRRR